MRCIVRVVIVSVLFCSVPLSDACGQVYKRTNEQGITEYTSYPPAADSTPIALQPIDRFSVKGIRPIEGCNTHGGIDCVAGADTDGSIVCRDGYRDATARFAELCSSARLELASLDVKEQGVLSALIRNTKPVAAAQVAVLLDRDDGSTARLEGPTEIEPFGSAEFLLPGREPWKQETALTRARISIECENCR